MTPARTLQELLAEGSELNIVCHNNPDPDCPASAFALGLIAVAAGIDEHHILYSGDISHQQNRAFVNLLDIDLEVFEPADVLDREEGSLLAFVDHAVPGENNHAPEGTPVDIVIDHHPYETIDARFVDHREEVGATSTILTEYVHELGIEHGPPLATALLFAIRRETLGYLRGTTRTEYDASGYLHDHADRDMLRQLSSPAVSGATVDAIATAVENRTVRGSVLITHVGRTTERDPLPQSADYLTTLEGVETAVVFGVVDVSIQFSGRFTDSRVHIGDVLHGAFADVGSAGGHREMAAGEVPLGIFGDYTSDDTELLAIIERVMTARFLAALNLAADQDAGSSSSAKRPSGDESS